MTVAQLIEALSKMPPELDVVSAEGYGVEGATLIDEMRPGWGYQMNEAGVFEPAPLRRVRQVELF